MRPDRFFVTQHAMQRFRERVTPDLSDQEIIQAITDQLAGALPVWVGVPPQQHVGTLLFPFRWGNRVFTIPVGRGEGPFPAVMTIRPGDDKLRRYERWKSPKSPWKRRHTMQAQFLLSYGYSIEDVAEILRYPVETVRQKLEEARRGLDAPDDPDPTCRTCSLFVKATRECMHYDTPVRPTNRACEHYQEDQWEVFKLAGRLPDETIEQIQAMAREGLSEREVARRLGVSRNAVAKYTAEAGMARRRKARISEEMVAEARRLRAEGISWREVARLVGASVRGLKDRMETEKALSQAKTRTVEPPEESPRQEVARWTKPLVPAPVPAPECETCIHQAVCRYREVYSEHKEWAICKHYAAEARAS